VLTGEVGKMVPVSRNRIRSIAAAVGGGFEVGVMGAPGERVTMGAANTHATACSPVVYSSATIGADGTATITLQ
jgi:hypothetical protein